MKNIFLLALLLCLVGSSSAQSFTEKIAKTLSFDKKSSQNAVMVYNIDGNVTIEGTTGDQIIVEVEKTITAKTNERLTIGKEDIQLGILDRADTIIFYVKGTGQEFGYKKFGKTEKGNYGYHGNNNGRWEDRPFDYTMNFKIKVPSTIHILASTINDGDVLVKNIVGRVNAHNINGDIKLEKLSSGTYANTINGDVDIDYLKNPTTDCKYYSLNGHVNVSFPNSVSATMSFKSFNGDLFTNIESLETMPPMVTKNETNKGTKYKVEMQRFKIRSGGPHLDVETFNGDATIKENVR